MTAAAAAPEKAAISFGDPDDPPQGAVNATNPRSVTDPGPQNPAIRDQFPSAFSPPPTDVGNMPLSWASFNNAPRRIQNGGWAREVTQSDFAVANTISGVNMWLTSGGIREMHWHQMTLVAIAREQDFEIFSHPKRISGRDDEPADVRSTLNG